MNGLVWIGDTGGRLVAFDAEDGRALWRSPPLPLAAAQAGEVSVVVAGEYVLAATGTDGIRAYRVPSH